MRSLAEMACLHLVCHRIFDLPDGLQEFVLDIWRQDHKARLAIHAYLGSLAHYADAFVGMGFDVIPSTEVAHQWDLYKDYHSELDDELIGDLSQSGHEVVLCRYTSGWISSVVLSPQHMLKPIAKCPQSLSTIASLSGNEGNRIHEYRPCPICIPDRCPSTSQAP